MIKLSKPVFIVLFVLLIFSRMANAYGVLTHEAIVDAAWEKSIVPLLKAKYPGSTEAQLKEAHAFAYGGAVAPDMGYYPRGSRLFTDLVHYVRSGEMVRALLEKAESLNQYAFALGFLAHYEADRYGHPLGTNKAVTIVYPKLQKRFGNDATYAEDRISHVRMEFGFDVLEVAKGNYVSQSYRDLIGFKVDTTVLSKAFKATYGLDINNIFSGHFSRSVETFRWVVANILPLVTKAAWAQKKAFIQEHDSTATARSFRYKMRQRNYNKEFGKGYKQPGFFTAAFSFFIRVLPKVGPLRVLKFKAPTPEAEKVFTQSFDTVLHYYTTDLGKLSSAAGVKKYADIDFDTGRPTAQCEYIFADATYASLLLKLKENNFISVDPVLQKNIIDFYADIQHAGSTKKCAEFYEALSLLKAKATTIHENFSHE